MMGWMGSDDWQGIVRKIHLTRDTKETEPNKYLQQIGNSITVQSFSLTFPIESQCVNVRVSVCQVSKLQCEPPPRVRFRLSLMGNTTSFTEGSPKSQHSAQSAKSSASKSEIRVSSELFDYEVLNIKIESMVSSDSPLFLHLLWLIQTMTTVNWMSTAP